MIGLLRALGIVLLELGPLILALVAIAAVVRWRARPQLVAHEAWRLRRLELEAEVVRRSHDEADGVDALVAAQGELAAHDVLEPPRPWWARG